MKLLPCCVLLSALLLTSISSSFAMVDTYIYENPALHISVSMPEEFHEALTVCAEGDCLHFVHQEGNDCLFTLERHDRNAYFADMEQRTGLENYDIVAMTEQDIWTRYCEPVTDDTCEACLDMRDYFNKFLSQCLVLEDVIPIPTVKSITTLPMFTAQQGMRYMTRGECAKLLYDMLDTQGYVPENPVVFSDMTVADPAFPLVSYLESYDIFNGYPDHTFRSHEAVTRAEFVVLVHHILFQPENAEYSKPMPFLDLSATSDQHWATPYLCNAWQEEWIYGQTDNTLRPGARITYAEAIAILVRALDAE